MLYFIVLIVLANALIRFLGKIYFDGVFQDFTLFTYGKTKLEKNSTTFVVILKFLKKTINIFFLSTLEHISNKVSCEGY